MEREPKLPTARGPAATFTGDVWVDPVATGKPEPSRMIVTRVRFAPSARTAWHSHTSDREYPG
jgi:quercetin dioxygenase-like cupin family protein